MEGLTSASTAVAPARSIPTIVGTHVFGAVITSSLGLTPDGEKGDRDRVRAVRDADAVADAARGGEVLLEALDLRREDVRAALEHAGDRVVELGPQRRRRAGQVEERHLHSSAPYSSPCSR